MYKLFIDEGSKPEQPKEPEAAPAKETGTAEPQEDQKVLALEILSKNPSFITRPIGQHLYNSRPNMPSS